MPPPRRSASTACSTGATSATARWRDSRIAAPATDIRRASRVPNPLTPRHSLAALALPHLGAPVLVGGVDFVLLVRHVRFAVTADGCAAEGRGATVGLP